MIIKLNIIGLDRFFLKMFFLSFLLVLLALTNVSYASGWPVPWQINFQEAATPLMTKLHDFHNNYLLVMCFGISALVALLLIYVCIRYSAKNNPIPSKTSHNVTIEIIWTVIPLFIIIFMAFPSFKILYYADKTVETAMTIKVVGRQWYWQYNYPDHEIAFDSYIIPDAEIKPGQFRLLEVDNRVVLPVDTNVKILITSGDVVHSWAVPSFGIKIDAVPGRVNETWVRINKPGIYYGQCSELCGINHGFMPIAVEAIPKEEFDNWILQAKTKFAFNLGHNNIYFNNLL